MFGSKRCDFCLWRIRTQGHQCIESFDSGAKTEILTRWTCCFSASACSWDLYTHSCRQSMCMIISHQQDPTSWTSGWIPRLAAAAACTRRYGDCRSGRNHGSENVAPQNSKIGWKNVGYNPGSPMLSPFSDYSRTQDGKRPPRIAAANLSLA